MAAAQHSQKRARQLRSGFGAAGLGPAPVKPNATGTPEQAPEQKGDRRTQLAALQGVDAGIDQARVDQGAADPPAQQPAEQEANRLEITGHVVSRYD